MVDSIQTQTPLQAAKTRVEKEARQLEGFNVLVAKEDKPSPGAVAKAQETLSHMSGDMMHLTFLAALDAASAPNGKAYHARVEKMTRMLEPLERSTVAARTTLRYLQN